MDKVDEIMGSDSLGIAKRREILVEMNKPCLTLTVSRNNVKFFKFYLLRFYDVLFLFT